VLTIGVAVETRGSKLLTIAARSVLLVLAVVALMNIY
jgi:hypothetical protein